MVTERMRSGFGALRLLAVLLLVGAAAMAVPGNGAGVKVSQAALSPDSVTPLPAPSPNGNVTATVGVRLAILGAAPIPPGVYSDLPVVAQQIELVGRQSFTWTFLSRVGDRAGANVTVANFGTRGTVAVLRCVVPSGLEFASLETPGFVGAVQQLGTDTYGMLLPGGGSGTFTLVLLGQSPGQYASACTIADGSP